MSGKLVQYQCQPCLGLQACKGGPLPGRSLAMRETCQWYSMHAIVMMNVAPCIVVTCRVSKQGPGRPDLMGPCHHAICIQPMVLAPSVFQGLLDPEVRNLLSPITEGDMQNKKSLCQERSERSPCQQQKKRRQPQLSASAHKSQQILKTVMIMIIG